MSRRKDEDVVLGTIRGVFGVRGWVRVESFTDPAENILDYARWRVSTRGGHRVLCPREGRWHGPGLIVQLATEDGGLIADRDAAAALVNAQISVSRHELPELDDGEVYWSDLVGLRVIGLDDEVLGDVAAVLDNPAHPILRIESDPPLLIPFVRGPIVESVDLDLGEIRVQWASDYAL